jgi:hypothetical protein
MLIPLSFLSVIHSSTRRVRSRAKNFLQWIGGGGGGENPKKREVFRGRQLSTGEVDRCLMGEQLNRTGHFYTRKGIIFFSFSKKV